MPNVNSKQPLQRVVYSSVACKKFTESELEELLKVSRANNEKLKITGILLYKEGSFFQVIEGPFINIRSLFTRIEFDNRHQDITVFQDIEIDRLTFGDWSMAYHRTCNDLLDGFSDFLHPVNPSHERKMPEGTIKILLKTFKQVYA